ncbi:MAG: preprotein translocase subunit SecG [Limnochordales bacterium]|nr:preprotein translocase subunit SecG [Limnochordales bacterium]
MLRTLLEVVLLLVGIGLTVVVAVQRSKGEGLGSIGGGARIFFNNRRMGKEALLDRLTVILGVTLAVLSILLIFVQ